MFHMERNTTSDCCSSPRSRRAVFGSWIFVFHVERVVAGKIPPLGFGKLDCCVPHGTIIAANDRI